MQDRLFEGIAGSLREAKHVVVLRVGVRWACACWQRLALVESMFAFFMVAIGEGPSPIAKRIPFFIVAIGENYNKLSREIYICQMDVDE